ncbi:MAG TPA: hypothetical protein VJU15_05555 [Gemmatimonadales bacterium]|nr:hypothetical protein [Gemmatimonadales bacterium]
MTARQHHGETGPETLLLVPIVLVLFGLVVYLFVEILPRVRVLPG